MSNMTKEEIANKPDILDDIKNMEKLVKVRTLQKAMSSIKEKARKILELKEETTAILDSLEISSEDSKRIIDFVNSLTEVKLTEDDKKSIRDRVKSTIKDSKETISRKLSDRLEDWGTTKDTFYSNMNILQTAPYNSASGYTPVSSNTTMYCNAADVESFSFTSADGKSLSLSI